MNPSELVQTPLAGTNLIEASAGTGKTYTIEGLFLRLLLEKQLTVEQILVVTFTKAATEELKSRIRNKICLAKAAFLSGQSDDLLIESLVRKTHHRKQAIQLLQDALTDFDQAAIFTIHGFCQRILHENAFETGSLFDTELITEQNGLLREIGDDFWRKHFYKAIPEFVNYAVEKIKGPEYFMGFLRGMITGELRIIPELSEPVLESLPFYREAFHRLKMMWPSSKETVTQLLQDPALNATIYGSMKPAGKGSEASARELKISSLAAQMDRMLDSKNVGFPIFKEFEKFNASKLIKSTRKGYPSPEHPFFNICDEIDTLGDALGREMDATLLFLKCELFRFAASELSIRKNKSNIQFFDDLLMMVKNALEDSEGNVLAAAIRLKYKAALVDEFQDTDSVQYQIFSKLFAAEDSILFMIGDPKQAIYGFRGADIFSYMRAAEKAEKKYTLFQNWRSDPGLIQAVNAIFSNVKNPFIFKEIAYLNGTSAKTGKGLQSELAPLQLWFLNGTDNKPIPKSEATDLISEKVAGEIARILTDETESFAEGDIAVLVRTNRQAQIVRKSLSNLKVPSVHYNTGNIFESHEASELEKILLSIVDPGNERKLKAALSTDLMGAFSEHFQKTMEESSWLESQIIDVKEYFHLWNTRGFIQMFRKLLSGEKVPERLLSFPDGERRLTNLLHLAELLQQELADKRRGMVGLVKWFSEQRNNAFPGTETHQLRLESDAGAVKIVTIHKSKGLEYPVVFCPFSWEGSEIKGETIVFHDPESKKITLDLRMDKNSPHFILAQNEALAENIRLLYVALTRARTRCYLAWGNIRTAETSALSYLLHHGGSPRGEDLFASLKQSFSIKNEEERLADLQSVRRDSDGNIEIVPLRMIGKAAYTLPAEREPPLLGRKFSGLIDHSWKISSFTSLVSHKTAVEALPDRDAVKEIYGTTGSRPEDFSDEIGSKEIDIFSFPKGPRAGTFFHELFEQLDFTEKDPKHRLLLTERKLKDYGFESLWVPVVCSMIQRVINVPLPSPQNEMILSSVQNHQKINEMEFYFPIHFKSPQRIKSVFESAVNSDLPIFPPEQLGRLTFAPAKGYMKGFIDLVFKHQGRFYIVDWKSNYLGARVENYDRQSISRVMKEALYHLQYLIYTLALHQYLRIRLPDYRYEQDFGGIFYLFIRGIDADRGREYGIFADRPTPEFIHTLGKELIPDYNPKRG